MPVSKVWKHKARMIRASRLEALGLPDAAIAFHIGLTPAGLATLKQSDEYKRMQVTGLTHVLGKEDEDLAEDTQLLREMLKDQVPVAMQTMADLILQRTDPKLAFQVAESVLDRDGRFTKASRTIVSEEAQPDYLSSKDDETVSRIANAQQPVKPGPGINSNPATKTVQ
jgi:hypothetical protein